MPTFHEFEDLDPLLGAQLNDLRDTAIPRFASSAARNTAYPSPETGQSAYVTGTGVTLYNGTTWQTVLPNSSSWTNFPTLYSTWTAYGGSSPPPRYRRGAGNSVHLDGMLRAGASSDSDDYVVILPSGYRPTYDSIVTCAARVGGEYRSIRCTINTAGEIHPNVGSPIGSPLTQFTNSTDWISFSGISFAL